MKLGLKYIWTQKVPMLLMCLVAKLSTLVTSLTIWGGNLL